MHAFSKICIDHLCIIHSLKTIYGPSTHHLIFKYRTSKTKKNFFLFFSSHTRAAYKFSNFCRALLTVNISKMADKEKRFRKILLKRGLKGRVKLVDTLEQAHFVLVNRKGLSELFFIKKEAYSEMIERGYTFPEEEVYFTVSSNPRDSKHIEERYLMNAFSNIRRVS